MPSLKFLLAVLPLAAYAAPLVRRQQDVDVVTVVQTMTQAPAPTAAAANNGVDVVTVTVGGPAPTSQAVAAAVAAPAATQATSAAAAATSAAAAPSTASSSGSSSSGGSASSGGCPADTSGQHLSPGVNGQSSKSMVDSINYMRRLYNSNANCLTWSDSLASSSDTCANAQTESLLRMNSDIVSAPGYGKTPYYTGSLASTEFEQSMFWMLCQSPSDPELKGTCNGKTGEVGCSGAACTGHHDAIVDAQNQDKYMGCGVGSGSDSWLSCSFSGTS